MAFTNFLLLLIFSLTYVSGQIDMTKDGCGKTKFCLFKPNGCVPNLDCTMAVIFFVSGPNQLTIQMAATVLQPQPLLQYVAVGFSKDQIMSDDAVSECVMDPRNHEFSIPEVFLSHNIKKGKGNTRVYLSATDRNATFKDIRGSVEESRFSCQFTQTIVPQIPNQNDSIWNLNHKLFIFGATGKSEANEIMVHDLNPQSYFFPIISPEAINPSTFGEKQYDLPKPYSEEEHNHANHENHENHENHSQMTHHTGHKMNDGTRNFVANFVLLVLFMYILCEF